MFHHTAQTSYIELNIVAREREFGYPAPIFYSFFSAFPGVQKARKKATIPNIND